MPYPHHISRSDCAELLKRHAIATGKTIREALEALNSLSGDEMTLFALEPDGTMTGTVTDGDIRRALIAGAGLDTRVGEVAHRDFLFSREGDDLYPTIAEARRRHIKLLPVFREGKVADIIDLRHTRTSLPIDAVLMAGGRGERLRPLTLDTPKPLLEVGGKPIIDYNVDELEACGVGDIYVTVNYLADQVVGHFERRGGRSRITCVREPRRLGTMGSLTLVEGLRHDNVLVMNSDLLTTLDFEAMYLRHIAEEADMTVAAVPYTVSVPFAIMRLEGHRVTGLTEKPTFNYSANAGVYILQRSLIAAMERGAYLDAPDFMERMIAEGRKVCCHPVEGSWIDIGSPDDFRYANEIMSHRR